jgi:SAM-dependent methyltransferase
MLESELRAMLHHDEHHWWYRGRRQVLRAVLDRLPLPCGARLLDAGCGSGRTLDELDGYGAATGLDISPVAVGYARARGHRDVRVGAVEAMPFGDGCFDLATCLDVIEHTSDDRATLGELRRVVRPGGLLVVTVPAHPALWSTHDEVNLHYRRYRRADLRDAATYAGWTVVSDTYFNSLLLGPAALVRWTRRLRSAPAGRSELDLTPTVLDRLLETPLAAEAALLARGGRVPLGLSLLVVLRRPAQLRTPLRVARPPRLLSVA